MSESTEPTESSALSSATPPLSRWWQLPLQSLTSRFVCALVAAVLVTSMAVTSMSIQATESFLHEKIEQKFATALSATRQRIELWHAECELELDTLSRSGTLAGTLPELQSAGLEASTATSGHRYLTLVLEQLPQYRSLFLLDPEGTVLAWVGETHELEDELRQELAAVAEPSVGQPRRIGAGRIHVASAPILAKRGKQLGSVHGLLRNRDFDELLSSGSLGPEGEIFVVGSDHSILAPLHSADRKRYERALPEASAGDSDAEATVERYAIASGIEVVGGALPLARHGWTLVVEEPYASAFAPVVAIERQTLEINFGIIAVLSGLAFFAARSIVKPVHALSEAAREIADGNLEVEIPVSSSGDEIGVMTRALGEMIAMLRLNQLRAEEQNVELEHANQQLEQLAITDGLTGLYNHRYFQIELEREMKRAARSGDPLSLILADIDDFKALNDRHGHSAGDEVLRQVALRMKQATRDTDLLARYGGEEFVLLCFRNPLPSTIVVAEKLRQAVGEAPVQLDTEADPLRVTVSIGVAEFDGDERAFFNRADQALYAAKAGGKDCVIAADEI